MDSLLSRYRNLTVLIVVLLAQLVLLAWQVKTQGDVRLIRVWSVTAVTPLARVIEGIRSGAANVFRSYFLLAGTQSENARLKEELGRLKMENQYLQAELATAKRAEALQAFQKRSPSKTVAARVIGTSAGTNARVVFVDRGSTSGVLKGMAVLTPDGIVGKVVASYPTAAQVQLITDNTFAAGVISQKNSVSGTLKGQGRSDCLVDYIQNEQKVEQGEWFFTSGDDRVFPKGLPVGRATVVRQGRTFKEVFLSPVAFQGGLEEVLIVIEGVHQGIPEEGKPDDRVSLLPSPQAGQPVAETPTSPSSLATDADRLKEKYKAIGDAASHKFGEGMTSPDFNRPPVPAGPKPATPGTSAPAPTGTAGAAPATESAKPPAAKPIAPKPVPEKPAAAKAPETNAPAPQTAPPQPR